MWRVLGLAAIILGVAGCASHRDYYDSQHVVVDMQGVDPYRYEVDLADCEDYAYEVNIGKRTAGGAVEGAVVGGVVGAAVGDSNTAGKAAGAGAVLGGFKANKRARYEQRRIVKNCLHGRGYRVLN